MALVTPLYIDPFQPILFTSESLDVSVEQRLFIRKILLRSCSDSRFAEKAFDAIELVLTQGSIVPPVVTSINPESAALGSPSFTLHVVGTGFKPTDQIVWNGSPEPTTFVSETELTTEVNMDTATTAMDLSVSVVNAEGVSSNFVTFTLNPVTGELGRGHQRGPLTGPMTDAAIKNHETPILTATKERDVVKTDLPKPSHGVPITKPVVTEPQVKHEVKK